MFLIENPYQMCINIIQGEKLYDNILVT